jgi:RNA polymerase sigma-70 factor (ECF subfamily)
VNALFAFCLGLTGSRQAARELVQDTFVRAWEALATFRGDSAFATWLHRIAVNVMLADRRSARRRLLRVAIEADLAAGDSQAAAPGAIGHGIGSDTAICAASDTASHTALRLDLEAAIARLPAGARAVFVLHDVGGYAHLEIAAALGIAEGTSRAHLFRARRLLRGMLDR